MEISGSSFLVTGGASGLGAACCRQLAAIGAKVLIADTNEEAGNSLADTLGTDATFVATDVRIEEDLEAAVATSVAAHGPLRGLIACAGVLAAERVVGRNGPHDLKMFHNTIDINLNGTFNAARSAAVEIAKSTPNQDGERGVIIMTASIAAWDGQIGQAAYAASKGGIVSMTLPMARELGRHGIRVTAIAPGIFATPMMESVNDGLRESLESQIPFPQRFGLPAEFASLAQHIIENQMINGSVLRLDGAVRMGPH